MQKKKKKIAWILKEKAKGSLVDTVYEFVNCRKDCQWYHCKARGQRRAISIKYVCQQRIYQFSLSTRPVSWMQGRKGT